MYSELPRNLVRISESEEVAFQTLAIVGYTNPNREFQEFEMGKKILLIVELLMVISLLQAQESVTLSSFGQTVVAAVSSGELTWTFIPNPGSPGDPGRVDWKGVAPSSLRSLQSVTLPDGSAGLAVLGTRSGRDGLFLLHPVWGGAELWGDGAWLEGAYGRPLLGYRDRPGAHGVGRACGQAGSGSSPVALIFQR